MRMTWARAICLVWFVPSVFEFGWWIGDGLVP